MFHDLLCGTTYNGKPVKLYCAVERDDFAALKAASFMGLQYMLILIKWKNACSEREVVRNFKKLTFTCSKGIMKKSMTEKETFSSI